MKVACVISEYNPFHGGHAYHFSEIRKNFGPDTAIVAVMSGNFVQRGDVAAADKWTRAKAALLGGANLVLELPFPYSMMSAERYGAAGVFIADALGCVDVLSFGSESGDIETLKKAADLLSSETFEKKVKDTVSSAENIGFPAARAKAASEFSPELSDLLSKPNNNLALSYLISLKNLSSKIVPHTVKRIGTPFSSETLTDGSYPSSTALRAIAKDGGDILAYLPESVRTVYEDARKNGNFPCNLEKIAPAILSYFRLSPTEEPQNLCDVSGGLYTRLRNASFEAADFSAFLSLVKAKHLTDAHLRRAILSSFFGVTSSESKEAPAYTQLLAADRCGTALLRVIAETGNIPVLTKPSATETLSVAAKAQKAKADRADAVFELSKPMGGCGNSSLKATPYIR